LQCGALHVIATCSSVASAMRLLLARGRLDISKCLLLAQMRTVMSVVLTKSPRQQRVPKLEFGGR
jgi:hypothetical protein